jgi:subtilase family serine protease
MTIEGLDNIAFEHHYIAQASAIKGLKEIAKTAADEAAVTPAAAPCIAGTGTEIFTSGGTLPYGVFTGNIYAKSTLGCGFTPPQIQAAYGLTALYAAGYNGAGQTIVILDWCGSPTITADANAFSARYGLPALNSSNFQIVDYPGVASCAAPDPEINIDVEWAHAIAPGANIVLVVPPSGNFDDVDAGLLYEVENPVGNISSNSYGSEELYTSSSVLLLQNFIAETAAAVGIAMNFSSGDNGDFTFDFPQYNPPSVLSPADSPYVTAVGGISLQLSPARTIVWQTAWGTNETLLSEPGFVPVPAANLGFNFGSGGGPSAVFPKLAYQAKLPGKYRQVPDVSWLADPFTGAYIAISEPFTSPAITYQVYGGTSLACPMFSALWAIANQVAGSDLGEAAPILYGAPATVFTDIVPYGSKTNVTALYETSTGNVHESANALVAPLQGSTTYQSAIWNYPDEQNFAYLLTFGTDSGLEAAKGWDPATGLGVTKPAALMQYISGLVSSAKK